MSNTQSGIDAVNNEAIGETIARLSNDQAALLRKKARQARMIIIAGIVWSFVYTAVSIFVMYQLAVQNNEVCEQFSESRESVRELILADPEFDALSVDLVSAALPPIEC